MVAGELPFQKAGSQDNGFQTEALFVVCTSQILIFFQGDQKGFVLVGFCLLVGEIRGHLRVAGDVVRNGISVPSAVGHLTHVS
jgi:hypothetical protein